MLYENETQVDYDQKIKSIDKVIDTLSKELEDLLYKRHVLVAKMCGVNVLELIDYIEKNENDKASKDMVDVISSIVRKKYKQK